MLSLCLRWAIFLFFLFCFLLASCSKSSRQKKRQKKNENFSFFGTEKFCPGYDKENTSRLQTRRVVLEGSHSLFNLIEKKHRWIR